MKRKESGEKENEEITFEILVKTFHEDLDNLYGKINLVKSFDKGVGVREREAGSTVRVRSGQLICFETFQSFKLKTSAKINIFIPLYIKYTKASHKMKLLSSNKIII